MLEKSYIDSNPVAPDLIPPADESWVPVPPIDVMFESKALLDPLYVVLVVSVIYAPQYWELACTGTLVRAEMVLTTASCLMQFDTTPDPQNTVIYERPSGVGRRAIRIYIHPNNYNPYFGDDRNFDFAIITIERSNQIKFPALPRPGQVLQRSTPNCLLAGYGNQIPRFALNNFNAVYLNETEWDLLRCWDKSKICEHTVSLHFPFFMPCRNDIGSPIICNGTVIALYSPFVHYIAVQCLDSYVSYFAYVSSSIRWIEAIVRSSQQHNLMTQWWFCGLLAFVVMCTVGGLYWSVNEFMMRTMEIRASSVSENLSDASIVSVPAKVTNIEFDKVSLDPSIGSGVSLEEPERRRSSEPKVFFKGFQKLQF